MYKKLKIKMYKKFTQFCIGSEDSESIFNLFFKRYELPLIFIICEWWSNLSKIALAKTQKGTRKINISNTLLKALQNYKNKQDYLKEIYGKQYTYYHIEYIKNPSGKILEKRIVKNKNDEEYDNNLNLIFTREDGSYTGTDITRTPYQIIHNELGIKKCRFYDLRGSYATRILNNGVEIRDVADILGHRNIETTENFYISSTEDSRKYATEVFDNIIQSDTINKVINYKVVRLDENT